MSTIYFIRHGQASFGSSDYDVLSPLGHKQARLLADRFIKSENHIDVIYHGTMERQKSTANEFIKKINSVRSFSPDIFEVKEFNEHNTKAMFVSFYDEAVKRDSSIEGEMKNIFKSNKAFQKVYESIFNIWIEGKVQSDKIISYRDFCSGVNCAIEDIMKTYGKGKVVAVFTSGGPISYAVKKALNLSDEESMKIQWQVVNTGVSQFKSRENNFTLSTFNEFSHLEHPKENFITYR